MVIAFLTVIQFIGMFLLYGFVVLAILVMIRELFKGSESVDS